ncbi:MAG: phosphotransferase [Verrucomicrobiales bacterium]|nr:phosphotransferase [Verrucomicrobiales bacterium]
MDIADITALTRSTLPDWADAEVSEGGVIDRSGSGRRFFRLRSAGEAGRRLLAMHYSLERRENGRFAEITRFLRDLGVPVPAIVAEDAARQVLWVEDLGSEDLATHETADWATVRAPLYRLALAAVLPLHGVGEASPPAGLPELEPGFDEALYRWEQDYFFEHFAAHFSAAPAEALASIQAGSELRELAQSLAAEPRGLLHRDFQSSNVMIRDGGAWLIDYQGLRWGLPEYDLASLLYDPYVALSADQQEELARHYHALRDASGHGEPWERFRQRLDRCAVQRLMQALGAYGNLGLNKGQPGFLRHIPAAVARLREVAVERGAAPGLAPALSLAESRVA